MFIDKIYIKNYKKLHNTSICLSEKQNLFIGPNNSGKTSSIEVLVKFLTDQNSFSIFDVTIGNWNLLNELFSTYYLRINQVNTEFESEELLELKDLYDQMMDLLPRLKVVINVEENTLFHVQNLIPYLNKKCEKVAVTYTLEPKNFEELIFDYKDFKASVDKWKESAIQKYKIEDINQLNTVSEDHWPSDFKSYLASENRFNKYFCIKSYISNPDVNENEKCEESKHIKSNPLKNIVKVSVIGAQRGLFDSNDNDDTIDGSKIQSSNSRKLSKLFSSYYTDYINPINQFSDKDYPILNALTNSKKIFKDHLETTIEPIQKSMSALGYPGFGSPTITVRPQLTLSETLKSDTSLLLNTHKSAVDDDSYFLPEQNNGLGYQNLIAMFFKLNIFKQERKMYDDKTIIEPLHLVLIEEPEAHLHAQAQKVFISKAHQLVSLSSSEANLDYKLCTQLLISTHSSHITYKADIDELIYFNRKLQSDIYFSEVISLKNIELDPNAVNQPKKALTNSKFMKKYLQLYEHDLFFADAIILIEGISEKILLPELIKKHVNSLSSRYITILEIGGAYANRFIPFIEVLNRPTLIITDIDSISIEDKNKSQIDINKEQKSSNATINRWFEKSKEQRRSHPRFPTDNSNSVLDDKLIGQLLQKDSSEKIRSSIRLAYQYEKYGDNIYARTFEDAIALKNFEMFKNLDTSDIASDLIQKISSIFKSVNDVKDLSSNDTKNLFEAVNSKNVKSEFALDLLFIEEHSESIELNCPQYILEGLKWLEEQLISEGEIIGEEIKDGNI